MKERLHNDGLRKICGCSRRTWAKCPHAWHFAYKWGGVHHRFSLDRQLGRAIESKTEAENESEQIRIAIREGRFGQPAPTTDLTLRQLAALYMERYVRVEKPARESAFDIAVRTVCRTAIPRPADDPLPLGDWRLMDIASDTVEWFREIRRGQGVSPTGVNRNLQSLRAIINWGISKGYTEHTPFKRHGVAVVKISKKVEAVRARRLDADTDEQGRLLAACGPHLRAVVECAIETGLRRGEILSLQWSQVTGLTLHDDGRITWAARPEVVLLASKTKTRQDRRIPISSRLRAILELRRFDPAGEPLASDAFVFGNGLGQRVGDVGRAWETAVLRAHSQPLRVTPTGNLTPEARAALAAIDLHFHDLRREAGSRWLEGGVPIHVVRDWLGHTTVAQTSTYLAGSVRVQHDAMATFEARQAKAKAILQDLATGSGTGGRKSPQSAKGANRKPNKTAVGHEPTIM